MHKIIKVLDEESIVYKVQQENDSKRKTGILHRNMLIIGDKPLDNFDGNITISQKENMISSKGQNAKDKNTKAVKSSRTDKDIKANKNTLELQSEREAEKNS